MGEAIEWKFKIVAGAYKDRIVSRITGTTPTLGNACGKLLNGVMGRTVRPDEEPDADVMVGRLYSVVVSPKESDPSKTYVTAVFLKDATPTGATGAKTGFAEPKPPAEAGY
jgi:hypothetical protein